MQHTADLIDTAAWQEALAARLPNHCRVLRRLIGAVERDPTWRWLEIGCSIAQERGDALSDLDLGLGVDDNAWPEALNRLPAVLAGLGEVVDMLHHRIGEWGDAPHQRSFVQYADGVQIDLVAMPAGGRTGLVPGNIALYDADGRLTSVTVPSIHAATGRDVHEWTFLGWAALADLDKYLRRGSLWEALERLHEARRQLWRLWAAIHDVPYPLFGLTAVLDEPSAGVPPGIEATAAALDAGDLRRAALACAQLLGETAEPAATRCDAESCGRFARFVQQRLEKPEV